MGFKHIPKERKCHEMMIVNIKDNDTVRIFAISDKLKASVLSELIATSHSKKNRIALEKEKYQ